MVDRKAVGVQLLRVGKNADLAFARPCEAHLAHAIDRLEHALDLLLGNLGGLAQALVSGHHNCDDGVCVRVGLLDDRREHVGGKGALRSCDFFAHVLNRALDVALENEPAGDSPVPLKDHGGELVQPTDGADRFFEREHDLRHEFFRSGPGQAGVDRNGCRVGFREEVDTKIAERENPQDHEETDEHHRENRPLDADLSERHRILHG